MGNGDVVVVVDVMRARGRFVRDRRVRKSTELFRIHPCGIGLLCGIESSVGKKRCVLTPQAMRWGNWILCCLDLALILRAASEECKEQISHEEMIQSSFHRGVHAQYHLFDYSLALKEYETAAILLENLSSCPQIDCSGMLNDLGVLKRNQGDLVNAEKAFLHAMKYSSSSLFPLANLAGIKSLQNDYHAAANYYLQATQSPEVTPEILYNYAVFL